MVVLPTPPLPASAIVIVIPLPHRCLKRSGNWRFARRTSLNPPHGHIRECPVDPPPVLLGRQVSSQAAECRAFQTRGIPFHLHSELYFPRDTVSLSRYHSPAS